MSFRIKNLDKVLDAIREAISEFDDAFFKDIADYTIKRVQSKARSGYTMISGKEEKIKPLKPSTIKARERAVIDERDVLYGLKGEERRREKTRYRLDQQVDPQFFSPKRSNLTFSGQFLKSLKLTNVIRKERLITISSVGSREGGKLSNEKLARYLVEQGRSIFGIDKQGREAIKQKALREIRRQLKKKRLRK